MDRFNYPASEVKNSAINPRDLTPAPADSPGLNPKSEIQYPKSEGSQGEPCYSVNLGLMDYHQAWELQSSLVAARINGSLDRDTILFLEHPAVFTLGRRGGRDYLQVDETFLKEAGISIVQAERGGFITYHGPGQLVVYPIIDLQARRLGVPAFVAALEDILLQAVKTWGIRARRNTANAGIWMGNHKMGSIGIALRKGISFHGLALNVNVDLTPFSWIERDVYRRSAFALAGNRDAVDVLRAKGYAGRLRVIPQFGVDPALYHRALPPEAGTPFVIGYAGRLVPEKGVGDLLYAVAPLRGAWELWLLGSGPDRRRLEALAGALGIANRVQFEGQVPSGEVPERLARLHALVLPSHSRPNWVEQFGRILVEAMASGVPVIGSDVGEIPNVIGDAGLIYPEGEIDALHASIEGLMAGPDRWMIYSQRGCDRVLAHYTQARIAAETVEVYKVILEGHEGNL